MYHHHLGTVHMKRRPKTALALSPALLSIINDCFEFISRLSIVDKKGVLRKLRLNAEQIEIVEALLRGEDTLVLKPRQIGSSTAVAAYYFWRVYSSTEPCTHVVLSHKQSSARHIFDMMKRFYSGLPAGLQRALSIVNTVQMTFADTGATIRAESAGADGGLRSFTATSCHISEFAFAPNADELKATAIAALNGGQLCIESTANFFGDALQREIDAADRGEVDWTFLFFPWTAHAEYAERPPADFETDADHLAEGLSAEQQYWAAKMIGKLGETKFRREYPLSVEDAYAQTAGAWIDTGSLEGLTVHKADWEGQQFSPVDRHDSYSLGVDCGAGTGGDASVSAVVSARTGQLVEIRRSNTMTPNEWALLTAQLAAKWNGAKVLTEINGTYGGIIVTELKYHGCKLWKNEGKDWITTQQSKALMLNTLKERLVSGQITMLDDQTFKELRSFQTKDNGIIYCPTGTGLGHHGDSVIALALAHQCLDKVGISNAPYLPDWIVQRKVAYAFKKASKSEHRRY